MHHCCSCLMIALVVVVGAMPAVAETPLDECWQRSDTRVELGSCLAELMAEVDARMQPTLERALDAQASLDEVTGGGDSAGALRRAQMAFELYRELECSARRTQMASGTGSGNAYQSCWVELGRARIAALEEQGGAPSVLVGSAWLVTSVASEPVADGLQATMAFTDDGQLRGTTGCNSYFGSAAIARNTLEIGPVGATRRLCEPAENELEMSFLAALDKAAAWQLDGEVLLLSDAAGNELLRLRPAPADRGVNPQ